MTPPSFVSELPAAFAAALLCSGAGAAAAEKPSGSSNSVAIFPERTRRSRSRSTPTSSSTTTRSAKAIYSGNVVVIQGDTKMTCSVMTVFLDRAAHPGGLQTCGRASGPTADSGIRHLDATGPVTVISKTQVATGDHGSYDKAEDKVWLIGHVTLSDGKNVTKGDKLTYDLKNGLATVDPSAKSGRVHGQFVPNRTPTPPNRAPTSTKAAAAKPK